MRRLITFYLCSFCLTWSVPCVAQTEETLPESKEAQTWDSKKVVPTFTSAGETTKKPSKKGKRKDKDGKDENDLDEENAPLGGPDEEDAPLGGPDEGDAPLGGPDDENAPLGGPDGGETINSTPDPATPSQNTLDSKTTLSKQKLSSSASDLDSISNQGKLSAAARARDVLTLDVVTITGDAEDIARVTGSAHRVDKETLEQQQYDDVHRVLKQIPGVYVRDEDGFGLRPNIGLRGANSDRSAKITLMEDGVLLAPAPYSAPAAYYFPLTTRLTGVEVFKGPSSIQYGPNTIGGAMNMITRSVPAQGHIGSIDMGGGNFGSRKMHGYYGFGDRHFGVLIEGIQIGSDGFKELDNGGDTGFSKSEYMVKFRANNSVAAQVHHRLELKLGYSLENSQETYLGLSDEDFDDTPYRRYAASQLGDMDWWRTQGKLVYNLLFGDDVDVRFTLYRHDFSRQWTKLNAFGSLAGVTIDEVLADPDNLRHAPYYDLLRGTNEWTGSENERLAIGTNDRSYVSQGADLFLEWTVDKGWFGNTLNVGTRLHTDQIERDHTQREYDMFSGVVIPMTDEDTTKENVGSAVAISAFVFDELRFGSSLRLTPGLRFEHIETTLEDKLVRSTVENTSDIVLPGLGLWWSLNDHWGLLGGVHQGFSPLAPGQVDEAEPEKSTNYEFGTRFNYRRVHGEFIGFWNDYSNLVGTCTQSAGCDSTDLDNQFNAGQATVLGVETVIGTQFPLGRGLIGQLDLAYTFTQGKFDAEFDSGFSQWGEVEEGDELPYVPVHSGNLKFGLEHAYGGGLLSVSYVADMRDSAGQGSIEEGDLIPAHTVLDLMLYVLPTDSGRIYLGIDNALDTTYMVSRRPFGARPGKRRQASLGYQHTF